jgi:serine/threonine protein kinase
MNRPGALPPGTRIADLELERCLGASLLGFEYLARGAGSGSPCRLAEYMPAQLTERRGAVVAVRPGAAAAFEAGRRAFQLDADRFSLPRHESLAVARRLLVENGTTYVQLPWHDGQTLADEIGRYCAPVEPADVRAWLRAIGGALAQLHRGGVVHGGVSPARIVRLGDGTVRLGLPDSARWPLSAWMPEVIDVDDPSLAPEQLLEPAQRAQATGPWTDVYGLATIAHLAIASRLPPAARHRDACLARPSLLNFANARWEMAMLLAIDRALSPDPGSRPRNMDDFLSAMGMMERRARPRAPGESLLSHVLDQPPAAAPIEAPASEAAPATRAAAQEPTIETLSGPLVTPAPDPAPPPEPRRSSGWWQLLIVLLFALLAAVAIGAAARHPASGQTDTSQRPSETPMSVAARSSG